MDGFDWTTFTLRIPVRARMDDLYNAWTRAADIERWFLRKSVFTGPDQKPLDRNANVVKGGTWSWEWFGWDHTDHGRITKTNGKDHLQFTFAGECPVDIALKQVGEEVIVELTQSRIPTDDKSKRDIRLGCHTGWSLFLLNLKSVYEGGLDMRNKNPEHEGMINN
jgi:uncharacterized protein YndB with AHSA1/START domain